MTGKTSRPPSIRFLTELHDIALHKCQEKYKRVPRYGTYSPGCDLVDGSDPTKAYIEAKDDIIERVSKEIEEFAVKSYKKYGVISVPTCHRKGVEGNDRLQVELKMTIFPEAAKEQRAKLEADAEYHNDMKRVEDWYQSALQAALRKEDFPPIPEF
jgi:hypothetical protein